MQHVDWTQELISLSVTSQMWVDLQMDMEKMRQRCYPFWVAPEVLQGGAPSSSSDVYALGMLIFEMLYRREPFLGEDPEVLFV